MKRYFKPRSLTWWASVAPLFAGGFIAFEPVHEWAAMTESVQSVFGGAPAGVLINAGLAGIGLRGALA